MISTKETIYKADQANKKMTVTREFDSSVENVWRAWTEPQLLDEWWAPKPWKTNTRSMDFREGGRWLYSMNGPNGEAHWCKVDYKSITPNKSFSGEDGFCDENGKTNPDFPTMHWKCDFSKSGSGTKVQVEITFDSVEDMNKIVEMGFKEGFSMAHTNLDELLNSKF